MDSIVASHGPVESANVAGVNPVTYLVDVATSAKWTPRRALLPADFKAAA